MALRAAVSESAFFEIFPTVEDCYYAAYEHGFELVAQAVADAAGSAPSWLDRVRSGLVALLGFFDDEPSWARLLVLEMPLQASKTIACRQQLQHVLDALLGQDDGPDGTADSSVLLPELTRELVLGGVFSVIRKSVLENDSASKLVELAPSLASFIATQYGAPVSGAESSSAHAAGVHVRALEIAGAAELPVRATRRTTLVLRAIAQAPYSNNREIARAAGIVDEGQASKLLARLERNGLIENLGVGAARGEPNAWLLTTPGRRALELLNDSRTADRRGACGARLCDREEKE